MLYSNPATREFTVEPGCPWYEAQQSYGAPNVNWCEPTQCALINEPANAWSNLGFLVVAVAIYLRLATKPLAQFAKDWSVAIFIMGAMSFLYHATNNFFTQFFDFFGMFLMTSIPIAINILRVQGKDPSHYRTLYGWIFAANLFLFQCFVFMNIAVQQTVTINALAILFLELIAQYKENGFKNLGLNLKYFWLSGGIMAIAQTFSQLDLKRKWCEPENLVLHGHAIWHVIGSLGMVTLFLHYRQFSKK